MTPYLVHISDNDLSCQSRKHNRVFGRQCCLKKNPFRFLLRQNSSRAKVSHLLLSYEGAWRANTRRTKEDAQTQAEAYLEQIKGVDFSYLAQQYSEDPQKGDPVDLSEWLNVDKW